MPFDLGWNLGQEEKDLATAQALADKRKRDEEKRKEKERLDAQSALLSPRSAWMGGDDPLRPTFSTEDLSLGSTPSYPESPPRYELPLVGLTGAPNLPPAPSEKPLVNLTGAPDLEPEQVPIAPPEPPSYGLGSGWRLPEDEDEPLPDIEPPRQPEPLPSTWRPPYALPSAQPSIIPSPAFQADSSWMDAGWEALDTQLAERESAPTPTPEWEQYPVPNYGALDDPDLPYTLSEFWRASDQYSYYTSADNKARTDYAEAVAKSLRYNLTPAQYETPDAGSGMSPEELTSWALTTSVLPPDAFAGLDTVDEVDFTYVDLAMDKASMLAQIGGAFLTSIARLGVETPFQEIYGFNTQDTETYVEGKYGDSLGDWYGAISNSALNVAGAGMPEGVLESMSDIEYIMASEVLVDDPYFMDPVGSERRDMQDLANVYRSTLGVTGDFPVGFRTKTGEEFAMGQQLPSGLVRAPSNTEMFLRLTQMEMNAIHEVQDRMREMEQTDPERWEDMRLVLAIGYSGGHRALEALDRFENQDRLIDYFSRKEEQAKESGDYTSTGRWAELRQREEAKTAADYVFEHETLLTTFVGDALFDAPGYVLGASLSPFLGLAARSQAGWARGLLSPEDFEKAVARSTRLFDDALKHSDTLRATNAANLTGVADITAEAIGKAPNRLQRLLPWLPTRDNMANKHADTATRLFSYIGTRLDSEQDVKRVLEALGADPRQVVTGVDGMVSPHLVQQDGVFRIPSEVIATTDFVEAYPVIAGATDEILGLPSLNKIAAEYGYSFKEVLGNVDSIYYQQARKYMGLDRFPDVPKGTKVVRIVKSGPENGFIMFLDGTGDKAKVLKTTDPVPYGQAVADFNEAQKALKDAGKVQGRLGLKDLARPDKIVKQTMAEGWFALRPGHWLRNSFSAQTHLMTRGLWTTKSAEQAMKNVYRLTGGYADQRFFEATTEGVERTATAAVQFRRGGLLSRIPGMDAVIERGNRTWAGGAFDTIPGTNISIAEDKWWLMGYESGMETSHHHGVARRVRSQWMPELQRLGFDQQQAAELGLFIEERAAGGKQQLLSDFRKLIQGKRRNPFLFKRTQQGKVMMPYETRQQIIDIFESTTPANVQQQEKALARALDDAIAEAGERANQSGVAYHGENHKWTRAEAGIDAQSTADMLKEASKRAGKPMDKTTLRTLVRQATANDQRLWNTFRRQLGEQGYGPREVALARDTWLDVHDIDAAYREASDAAWKEAIQINTDQGWQRAVQKVDALWAQRNTDKAKLLQERAEQIRSGVRIEPREKPVGRDFVDQMAYDEYLFEGYRNVETDKRAIEAGRTGAPSVKGDQERFRFYREAGRRRLDVTQDQMWQEFFDNPTQENLDIVMDALIKNDIIAGNVAGKVRASAKLSESATHLEFRNNMWADFWTDMSEYNEMVADSMRRMGAASNATTADEYRQALDAANAKAVQIGQRYELPSQRLYVEPRPVPRTERLQLGDVVMLEDGRQVTVQRAHPPAGKRTYYNYDMLDSEGKKIPGRIRHRNVEQFLHDKDGRSRAIVDARAPDPSPPPTVAAETPPTPTRAPETTPAAAQAAEDTGRAAAKPVDIDLKMADKGKAKKGVLPDAPHGRLPGRDTSTILHGTGNLANDNAQSLAGGGGKTVTFGDRYGEYIHYLQQQKNRLIKQLRREATGAVEGYTTRQQVLLLDFLEETLTPGMDSVIAESTAIAKKMADDALLNFNDRLNVDSFLGLFFTFPYWRRATIPKALMNAAEKPWIIKAYSEWQRMVERENKQTGLRGTRYEGTLPNPLHALGIDFGPERVQNPMVYLMPIANIGFSHWSNVADANNPFEQGLAVTERFLNLTLNPVYRTVLNQYWDYANPIVDENGQPTGATRSTPNFNTFGPQGRIIGLGAEALGLRGAESPGRKLYEQQGDLYRQSRQIAVGQLGGEGAPEYTPEEAKYVQQYLANNQRGDDPMKFIPAQYQERVKELSQYATSEAAKESLEGVGYSSLFGWGGYSVNPNEQEMSALAAQNNALGYTPANPQGSREAREKQWEENPELGPWYSRNAEFDRSVQPGQQATTSLYWDEVIGRMEGAQAQMEEVLRDPTTSQEEKDALIKRIKETNAESIWGEEGLVNQPQFADVKTSDTPRSERPVPRGANPQERAKWYVDSVLAYEPAGKPTYPEGTQEEDPAAFNQYYTELAIWKEKQLEDQREKLEELLTTSEEGTSKFSLYMQPQEQNKWQQHALDLLQQQYPAELLFKYKHRYDTPLVYAYEAKRAANQEMHAQNTAAATERIGAQNVEALKAYWDLEGEAKKEAARKNPKLPGYSVAYWNPEAYDYLVQTWGEDFWQIATGDPDHPGYDDEGRKLELTDAQMQAYYAEKDAYYDQYPEAKQIEMWIFGRPKARFDVEQQYSEEQGFQGYDLGYDYELAKEIFGEDIFNWKDEYDAAKRADPPGSYRNQDAWEYANPNKRIQVIGYELWMMEPRGNERRGLPGFDEYPTYGANPDEPYQYNVTGETLGPDQPVEIGRQGGPLEGTGLYEFPETLPPTEAAPGATPVSPTATATPYRAPTAPRAPGTPAPSTGGGSPVAPPPSGEPGVLTRRGLLYAGRDPVFQNQLRIEGEIRQRTQWVLGELGEQGLTAEAWSAYFDAPKGSEARARMKQENPVLAAALIIGWNANEWQVAKEDGFTAADLISYAGRPPYDEADEGAARAAYWQSNPQGWLMGQYINGRPEPYDPTSEADDYVANWGVEYKEAIDKFGAGIWDTVLQYRSYPKGSTERKEFGKANPIYFEWSDWWYANMPDSDFAKSSYTRRGFSPYRGRSSGGGYGGSTSDGDQGRVYYNNPWGQSRVAWARPFEARQQKFIWDVPTELATQAKRRRPWRR